MMPKKSTKKHSKLVKFLKTSPYYIVIVLCILPFLYLIFFLWSKPYTKEHAYELSVYSKGGNYIDQTGLGILLRENGIDSAPYVKDPKVELNKTFFLVTEQRGLKPNKTLTSKNNDYLVTIVAKDDSLLPYLNDLQYCEQDNDCARGNRGCKAGYYNQFDAYIAYGCGPNSLRVEGYTDEDLKSIGCFPAPEYPETGPSPHVIFSTPKCVDNKCTGDLKVLCDEQ